jgi:anti-sigma B factor antagonist
VSSATFALAIETLRTGDTSRATVSVTGEIDVTNASDFVRTINEIDAPHPLIVDLSNVLYLDSAGFAALDKLLAQGAAVIVLDPNSPVHTAASLMRVPCHDTIKAAVIALEEK